MLKRIKTLESLLGILLVLGLIYFLIVGFEAFIYFLLISISSWSLIAGAGDILNSYVDHLIANNFLENTYLVFMQMTLIISSILAGIAGLFLTKILFDEKLIEKFWFLRKNFRRRIFSVLNVFTHTYLVLIDRTVDSLKIALTKDLVRAVVSSVLVGLLFITSVVAVIMAVLSALTAVTSVGTYGLFEQNTHFPNPSYGSIQAFSATCSSMNYSGQIAENPAYPSNKTSCASIKILYNQVQGNYTLSTTSAKNSVNFLIKGTETLFLTVFVYLILLFKFRK